MPVSFLGFAKSNIPKVLAPVMRFRLRTLMIVITALALWLGYEFNWIHKRHAFLAQQFEYHLAAAPVPSGTERREWVSEWWRGQTAMPGNPPRVLRLLGEVGVGRLSVIVPESDITMRIWESDAAGAPVSWPEIVETQADYRRAKRLFPEAEIVPVRPEHWSRAYRGGEMSAWLRPVVIREQASGAKVRLKCDPTVVEGGALSASIDVSAPSHSPVIVPYRTCDGTATVGQGNFIELNDTIVFEAGQTAFPSQFLVQIGWLTDLQRAAGGATFRLKLGVVVGAIADKKELTITILPLPNTTSKQQ